MSMVASSIASVEGTNFKWYVIFLEGRFANEVTEQIDKHFIDLGREVGKDVLAVRGYDRATFRKSVFEVPDFYHVAKWPTKDDLPAILVTDTAPGPGRRAEDTPEAKVIYFPLCPICEQRGDLSGFFEDLVETLQNPEAFEALESLKPPRVPGVVLE